ncbi:hypothetical protein [Streptomyces formicae]
MNRVGLKSLPDMGDSVDSDVSVLWYCPDALCAGHDGFSVQEQ